MGKGKPHIEFLSIDMEDGWETPPGYPDTFKQKILAQDIDEPNRTGSRSRLLKIAPGGYSTEPFVHEHWEEVYLLNGDLIVGNDANGEGGEKFYAPTYACRPPGVHHGPFKTDDGCVMFEMHYFYDAGEE